MKHTLQTLLVFLFASSAIMASPCEEPSQGPARGVKRTHAGTDLRERSAPPKRTRAAKGQAQVLDPSLLWGTLPGDALRVMAKHLSDKDLFSLAMVNHAT